VSGLGVSIDRLPGATALFRDYVARTDSSVHRRVGGFRASADAWARALASAPTIDARLVDRLAEDNAALGVRADVGERLRGLADGRVRAVVTGQQPGVAGGPLLSLYKAATAIALAEAIETRWKVRCVPLFWVGSDDDDFAEIRDLTIVSDALAVVSASLDVSAHAPGRRVGDIAAGAVAGAWDAVAPFLPSSGAVGEVAARVGGLVHGDGDLGRIAARVFVELTGGRMALVDARESTLLAAGREALLAFFDREDELRAAIHEEGVALVRDGYHAQLDTGSDSGLFVVTDGVRRRVPPDARAAARAGLARDASSASPGVVARNLVQDAVLAPAAVVLGPAEVAYRAQIVAAYDALGVARPVAFPRLGATFVPPAVVEAARATGVDVALVAADAPAFVARVMRALESPRVAEEAARFESTMRDASARFLAAAGERMGARTRDKLARRLADLAERAAGVARGAIENDALAGAARWPWLARAAELFARDGQPQERFLSALVPYLFHGRDAWALLHEVAATHVRDSLDANLTHRVYWR
jgi:hypothetical protein